MHSNPWIRCVMRGCIPTLALFVYFALSVTARAQINGCIKHFTTNCVTPPTASLTFSSLPRGCAGGMFFAHATVIHHAGNLEVQGTNSECVVVDTNIPGFAPVISASWTATGPGSVTNTGSGLTTTFPMSGATGSGTITFTASYTNVTCLSGGIISVTTNYFITNCQCTNAPSGLVGWWPGNDTTQDLAYGNDGTLLGNTSYTNGMVDDGFHFDGDSDAVIINDSENYQLQDFTISCWIKRNSLTEVSIAGAEYGGILGYGYGGYGVAINSSGVVVLGKAYFSIVSAPVAITDLAFHHLAVTKNGTNIIFYLDGSAYPGAPFDPGFIFTTPMAIGAIPTTYGYTFEGDIDEVMLFNRSLTSAEVTSLYGCPAGVCPPPEVINCLLDPSLGLTLATPGLSNSWPVYTNGATVSAQALIATNLGLLQVIRTNLDSSVVTNIVVTNSRLISTSWSAVSPDHSNTNSGSGLTASFSTTNGVGVGDLTFYLTYSNSAPCSNVLTVSLPVYFQVETNDIVESDCSSNAPAMLASWNFNMPLSLWSGESNANDTVGTNNAVVHSTMTYTNGVSGNAFYFNGSNYLSFGTNIGNFGTNDFTIDFWIQTTQSVWWVGILEKRPVCNWGDMWSVRLKDGYINFESDPFTTVTSTTLVSDGSFHHVTLIREGYWREIFVDGEFEDAAYSENLFDLHNNVEMFAGTNICYNGGTQNLVGTLDELSILTGSPSPWEGNRGQMPLVVTNVQQMPSPWGNSLQVDSSTNANLSYRYFDEDGIANVNCKSGALRFWIKPNWNGGTGPGITGRLIEMGDTNSTSGWWSLWVDSSGNQISFQTKSNGNLTTYFTQSISDWNSNYWYHVVLDYAADQTSLYTNGILAQTGIGITNYPSLAAREAYGFSIGSDHFGANRSASRFDELGTFCAPLTAEDILDDYVNGLMNSSVGVGTGIPDWDTYNQLYGTTNNGALEVFTPLK